MTFLFGSMKEPLKGRSFTKEEDPLSVFSEVMSELSHQVILRVFTDWDRRLRHCFLAKDD
jgi:hypothetical protein